MLVLPTFKQAIQIFDAILAEEVDDSIPDQLIRRLIYDDYLPSQEHIFALSCSLSKLHPDKWHHLCYMIKERMECVSRSCLECSRAEYENIVKEKDNLKELLPDLIDKAYKHINTFSVSGRGLHLNQLECLLMAVEWSIKPPIEDSPYWRPRVVF